MWWREIIISGWNLCLIELWWLEGLYHDRNKEFDTREKCENITRKLREGIKNEDIIASHVRYIGGIPVMFVHAGYRKEMIEFMKRKYSIEGTAEELSAVTNRAMKDVIIGQVCIAAIITDSNVITWVFLQGDSDRIYLPRGRGEELFEAGRERGGNRIGGPFWTDFKVLQQEYDPTSSINNMLQIVGHTAQRGSFRGTPDLSAICIDAAMYTGTSTFLEIGYDLHFRLHLWSDEGPSEGKWAVQDVTANKCTTQ